MPADVAPIALVLLREAGPIQEQATRYRCPHCRRSYAHQGPAAKHMLRCFSSPFTRACKTCKHWTRAGYEQADACERDVDLGVARCSACGEEVEGADGVCADGHEVRALYGLRVQCDLWASAEVGAE